MINIDEKINQLASDLVMLDLAIEEDFDDFLKDLDALQKYAEESDFEIISQIISLLKDFLKTINLADEKLVNQLFTFLISFLQNIVIEKERGNDISSYLQIFEKELDQLNPHNDAVKKDIQMGLTDTQKEMLPDFISDANSILTIIENDLLDLEETGQDSEKINAVFRSFHTLKGESGLLGLMDLSSLTHVAENILEKLRSNILAIDGDIITALLKVIDIIKKYFNGLLVGSSDEHIENFEDIKNLLNELLENKKNTQKTEDKSHKFIGKILVEEGVISPDELVEAIKEQEVSQSSKRIGEILQEKHAATKEDINSAILTQKKITDTFIKIKLDKLDDLIELVGELVIGETQVVQNPIIKSITHQRVVKDLAELGRITRRLQEVSMGMRLVPIRQTFQKMVRIVRDLSRKLNKDINVSLVGEDTEIDKNMVELISDPLVHMVRNSVDHGIESVEERKAKGKNLIGQIKLSAFHRGGNVVVEIHDDGAGINADVILKKAIEKGIINEGDNLSQNKIYNLIFEPGFSMAEEITDVSGRGVGMDVVKRNVEQLRGRVDISTEINKGSVFAIQLPITLAIIEGIILMSGEERYVLPINCIVEFINPVKESLTFVASQGEVYNAHGHTYSLIRLNKHFQLSESERAFEDSTICLVESERGFVCLLVDELLGQQQVVIKNLGERFKNLSGVSGGAILGDGRVGLILDVNGIVDVFKQKSFVLDEKKSI